MAPQKRKARSDDFFYYTIEDDEAVGDEDKPTSKKAKKADVVVEEDDDESVDEFDPTFEFFEGEPDIGFDEEENMTAQGLGLKGADRIVDLNELIERRREEKEKKEKEKKGKKKTGEDEEGEEEWEDEDEDEDEDEEEEDEDEKEDDMDLDDADDEVLAADGFGMGVDGDEEEEDAEGADEDKEDDDEDEDMAEGDDMDAEHGEDEDEDEAASDGDQPEADSDDESASTGEDEEERARQEEFFAAGEQEKSKSKAEARGGRAGEAATASSFQAMRLFSRPILRGIAAAGYETPTPIQAKTIPFAIGGHDVVGQAVTGSGKTAAFLLPILERLLHRPTSVPKTRVVVLTPTRELAVQGHKVAAKLASCTSITLALAVGGTSFKASEAGLRSRPDIVIATPGRFIDHMRNSPSFAVDGVEILVLDEADRMLQDGFADELNEIVRTLPRGRQTLLFSATMGTSVDQLIRVGLHRPVRIQADAPGARTTSTLTQSFVRLRPGREDKRLGYLVQLCTTLYRDHAIIFFREKRSIHEARIVFGLLGLSCEELHGNIRQAERLASLESFRRGAVRFLLASDLASRGLDIKGVETVINYEVPKNLEDYIHRIGRTARAGRRGVAVTIVAEQDRKFVKEVVKAMRGTDRKKTDGPAPQVPHMRIRSQQVDPAAADTWQAKIDAMDEDIEAVVQDERQARALARAEMEATRGENMLKHRDEILARPKRTWFESTRDKEAKRQQERRQVGAARPEEGKTSAMERLREKLKAKHGGGWLSRKDTKKLDAKKDRLEGLGGRKLKQEKKQMGTTGNTKAKGKVIKGGKTAKGLRGPKVKGARAKAGPKGKGRR